MGLYFFHRMLTGDFSHAFQFELDAWKLGYLVEKNPELLFFMSMNETTVK